ncbi:MAG: DNA polymerase III subunit beta [Ktedonobacteraceae bacterium]|nr:DNA polymerase III subunit beta [Ktedonobacteraceae bacterium]
MKVTCKQQDLNRGLSVVAHAVSNRSTLPILANVLLATDQGRLRLYATNLEIGINCWVDAQVHEEGSITVPAKRISDFVGSLPQAAVDIGVPADSYTVSVRSLRSSANIEGMDPAEFPLSPTTEGSEEPVTLAATQLKEMIEQVAFAAADDDSRPVFTGVLVKINNHKITFAAADAFRLAVRVATLTSDSTMRNDILIPARTLTELARILPSEGAVQMIVTPNRSQVLFHSENIDLLSRLIEGTFPNFYQIIPKESSTRAIIDTKEFAAAVRSVTPFARDSSNITRVKIASADDEGTVTIEATAEDVGSGVSTINAKVEGQEQEQQIIFNVKYLSDVLAVIDTPEVALEVTSPARPGVIKPWNSDEATIDYTYVIMPMSTNR